MTDSLSGRASQPPHDGGETTREGRGHGERHGQRCHRCRTTASKQAREREWRPTRRHLLTAGLALSAGLGGCLGFGGEDVPEPVTLTQTDQCEVCGMVIPNHPGPNAEIFYADEQPSGHDNPARFCSTWEAFQYDFERQDRGWDRQVFYVTDYSTVDWSLTEDLGDLLISTHPEASAFVDATEVTFVVGSEVKGAMGEDLIGFSKEADAEQFQRDHGGTLVAFGDVTRGTIADLAR